MTLHEYLSEDHERLDALLDAALGGDDAAYAVLGATIWTGGHLVLATRILPEVLRKRSARPSRRSRCGRTSSSPDFSSSASASAQRS